MASDGGNMPVVQGIPIVEAAADSAGDNANRHSYYPPQQQPQQFQGQQYAQAPMAQQMNHSYGGVPQQQQFVQPPQQHYAQPPQQHYAQGHLNYSQPPQQMQQYQQLSTTGILADAERLIVRQRFEPLEALANTLANAVDMSALGNLGEIANKYQVYADDGNEKFRVVEESDYCGPTGRCCCNPNHELKLHVYAPHHHGPGKEVMRFDRPCVCGQCCACCDICRQEMIAYDGRGGQVGYVKQPFLGGGFSPKLEVMDRDGDEPYATIESDATCCIAGLCCDHTFVVRDQGGNEIGRIVKQKPSNFQEVAVELASDSDVFAIQFRRELDTNRKATMFGALYLIDYMFFENEGEGKLDLVNQQCSFKCCDLYCCGCSCPCRCNCGGEGVADDGGGTY